ncbi:hypothetical protein [Methylobacterium sp. 1030]|uniref:phage adaptor protein n=1 Tax=Methylobacterium sp. 1030 TaxID=3156404 RepID=UPI0033936136
MATVRDLITRSLRLIQVIGAAEPAGDEDAADALVTLNEMLESWSIEKDTIFEEKRETFPVSAGTASYTIGPAGVFATVRPVQIKAAFLREGTSDLPLTIIDDVEYSAIPDKSASTKPYRLYYDANHPLGTLIFDSVPPAPYTLGLTSLKPLTTLADLNTVLSLPPGYAQALRYNLALQLAPEYERPVSDDVRRIAAESKGAIMDANTMNQNNSSQVDPALMQISCMGRWR